MSDSDYPRASRTDTQDLCRAALQRDREPSSRDFDGPPERDFDGLSDRDRDGIDGIEREAGADL